MENYCAFSKNHTCVKWIDYQITLHELEEADSLCHENYNELQRKNEYIDHLHQILDAHGIPYPEEYELY